MITSKNAVSRPHPFSILPQSDLAGSHRPIDPKPSEVAMLDGADMTLLVGFDSAWTTGKFPISTERLEWTMGSMVVVSGTAF